MALLLMQDASLVKMRARTSAKPDHDRRKRPCADMSKCVLLFTFIALFGFIFLLRNIHTVESWNCQTISTVYQLHSRIQSSLLADTLPAYNPNHTFCAHLGQRLTSEDELEERYLLDMVKWPSPPAHLAPFSLRQTSDPLSSLFTILPRQGCNKWHVGDQLEVLVQMYNFQGRPKHYGGDFLISRLHAPELGASVAGTVVDHRNGIYSVFFPLLWVGPAHVDIALVHSSEAVDVLRRLREERPDRVFFKSLFRLGFLSETTVCNMCLPSQQQPLCNYTDLYTGEPWYCYKPKTLGCDTRINHAKGGYLKHLITNKEALLLQSGVNIKVQISASGAERIDVLPHTDDSEEACSSIKAEPIPLAASGYYYKDSWRPTDGTSMHRFNDSSAIAQCLENKVINMYGDSTVRQWFEHLMTVLPEMKEINLDSPKNVGPFMAVDTAHNILLRYRCHGPPIRFSTVLASEMRYIPNELDGLSGGPNTVVVLSVWAHFSTFPLQVYIRRLRHIRRALLRLMRRAPGTLVVIRSANLQALDQEVSLFNSDWFSLQLDAVLKAMFKGLDVLMVDAWEMTAAHHLPHALHPPPAIVRNMIDMVLSYICPSVITNQK